ncbi:MAG: cadherin-like domain-containing protein [Verrucomicrobiales bacterium]|nr:cadherin-like domain-containing protein [Verrucomicrobiales bacterium]
MKFDGRGFLAEPRDGDWQWGLELKRYGFPGAERVLGKKAVVQAEGQRLTYAWDETLSEWYVNDQRGLEHGFTVKERPARDAGSGAPSPSSTLDFVLVVRGSLLPEVAPDGQGVEFRDAVGTTVINYSGLVVRDADGRTLPSRFAALDAPPTTPALVKLQVDERGSRYPLTIDPIARQAYLKASNTGLLDLFGNSVAVSGDTVVVGAPGEDSGTTGVNSTADEAAGSSGAAYVFVRSGTTWNQQAYLKASNTGQNDRFGESVAVSGDTVVIGARHERSSTIGVNSTPDDAAPRAGAAYVFVRTGTSWSQQAYLKASNTGIGDEFGASVAVSGNTLVVGASHEWSIATGVNGNQNDNSADNSGAAYVFVRSGTTWSQQAYLKASNTGYWDHFGGSVAVDGDTVVVGAPDEDSSTTGVNSTPDDPAWDADAGAAYVFVRSGTTWSQQAYLKASNTGRTDHFGGSVAVSGGTVVVGAPLEDSTTTGINSTPDDRAIYFNAGAAYVFVRIGTNWSQQAYLKAGNTATSQFFGGSVGVSGDTVVVGANGESSSTTGIDSTPDEDAYNAGASYVFVRNATEWSQQAYLKPSNTGMEDHFGGSVAMSGDTVVVGAWGEASSTMGVNGNQNDNSAERAGAAYVFSTSVNSNSAPVAAHVTYTRSPSLGLTISIAELLAQCVDADLDSLSLESVGASLQGAMISKDATHIFYNLDNDNDDRLTYQISDGQGGTDTGTITVHVARVAKICPTPTTAVHITTNFRSASEANDSGQARVELPDDGWDEWGEAAVEGQRVLTSGYLVGGVWISPDSVDREGAEHNDRQVDCRPTADGHSRLPAASAASASPLSGTLICNAKNLAATESCR